MALAVDDFEELLNAEQTIDLERISAASARGIPDQVLEIDTAENLHLAMSSGDYVRRLRGEVARYCKQRNHSKSMQTSIEQVIACFLSAHPFIEYSPELVSLCGPLVYVFQSDSLALGALGRLQNDWRSDQDGDQQISNFLMLFRLLLPGLYSHFQEEDVDMRELGVWFDTLLAKPLPLDCVLRLWDTYFSVGLELHVYVCLAILFHCKEDLEEQSDIHSFLQRLPALNMEAVLAQASQLRFDAMERSLITSR